MANRIRLTVAAGPTLTAATTQISLGTLDLAAVPGFGDLTALTRWGIVIRSRVVSLHNGGDHGAKSWEVVTALNKNSSGGTDILATPIAGNGGTGGAIQADGSTPPDATFATDISSNVVRFRVTPATTSGIYWMASHDVDILVQS